MTTKTYTEEQEPSLFAVFIAAAKISAALEGENGVR
jgi:hypothetical protein